MDNDQIKHMVNRFLMWKLPEHFRPDCGIIYTPIRIADGRLLEPSGTNLLDATQAEAMVRHMIEGLPAARPASGEREGETPEDRAEQFIQAAVDRAPEPLRRLGEWLANVLDEDEWKTAERMLLGATTAPAPSPAPAGASGGMGESHFVRPGETGSAASLRVWKSKGGDANDTAVGTAPDPNRPHATSPGVTAGASDVSELVERLGRSAKEALSADHLSFDVLWTRCDLWAGDMSGAAAALLQQAAEIERLNKWKSWFDALYVVALDNITNVATSDPENAAYDLSVSLSAQSNKLHAAEARAEAAVTGRECGSHA